MILPGREQSKTKHDGKTEDRRGHVDKWLILRVPEIPPSRGLVGPARMPEPQRSASRMTGQGRFHTKSEALSCWTALSDRPETQLRATLEVEQHVKKTVLLFCIRLLYISIYMNPVEMCETLRGQQLCERQFSVTAITAMEKNDCGWAEALHLMSELPRPCRGPRSQHDLWMVTANNKLMTLSKVISA